MNIKFEIINARRALTAARRSEEMAAAISKATGRAEDLAMADEARQAAFAIENSLGGIEAAIAEFGIEELQRRIDEEES